MKIALKAIARGQHPDGRVQKVQVSAQRKCDGRRGNQKIDKCGIASNKSAEGPHGAVGISKRTACVGYRGGEFGITKNKRNVHDGNNYRGDEETYRAGYVPAEIPAEVFAADNQAHRNGP
jgi:hypothetical protein